MQCLQLTRGEPPATTVDVALRGAFDSSYSYVKIDGTKYTAAQTLTVAKGTSVTVYCWSSLDEYKSKAQITLNGTTVSRGTSRNPATYKFSATDNCGIFMKINGSIKRNYYTADITMPA